MKKCKGNTFSYGISISLFELYICKHEIKFTRPSSIHSKIHYLCNLRINMIFKEKQYLISRERIDQKHLEILSCTHVHD